MSDTWRPEIVLGCWGTSEESEGRAVCEERLFLAGENELGLGNCKVNL